MSDIAETMQKIQQEDEVRQLQTRLTMLRNAIVDLDISMAEGDYDAVQAKLHDLLGDEATC